LDLALSIPAGRRLRARRTFALPIATENAARITWQVLGAITDEHVLFNGAQIAAGDQMTLPNVASAPLAERNRLEVSLSGEPGAAFRLVVTAESRVTALRADSPLYPGARVDLRLHFPELRFGSRMRFFLQPPPGVRGSATGAPIPVRRVDSHTGIVRLSLSPTIALGAIPLVVTFDGRAVAAGVATVQMPVPIGNALWSVADRSAAPPLATPAALARTANGQLFGAESGAHRIVRLKRNAAVIVAGSGAAGYADGRVAVAQFNTPSGLATHDGSPIFVADTGNHCIRLIERGRVTTFAGAPEAGFADGDARTARFNRPQGLALGPDGALYVADTGNHALRRVDSTGQVSTLIGNGEPGNADGTAGKARLHSPVSLAFGPDGTIYLTDAHRLRALSPRGILRTLAGSANSGFAADVGRRARFANPTGVAWMDDHLVVADTGNGLLRTVDPQTGATLVLAGGGTTVAETAGVVDGATAQLAAPTGIVALPEDGCLFAEGTSGQVCTLRPSRRLSVRLLNPPLTDFATGDRSLTLLLQTNRPDVAVAIGHRFDDGFVAQATGRSGADGLFSTGILLFSDAENRLEVRVRDGRATLHLALTIRQTSAALPVITAPIIGAALTLPNGLCRADVGPARTGAAICVAAGIVAPLTRGVASAQGSFSAALAAATLQGVGGEIVPLPVDLVSFAAQDGAPRLVQSQPLLVRTPASPPMVSILSPVAGEPLVANRVDVLVRADRAIAAGDVNGVPIGADGIAPNVPLTAAETVLSATVRDFRGLVGQASLTVQLAEGVPTKQLAAIQIATTAPAQGAPLTLTGANIGAAVSAIFISTNAGLTPVLFSVDGSDRISLTLPETAANGQIVVYAGDDAEIVPLNVRWEGTTPGAASDLLALSAPALGAPTGAAAYDAEEVSVRIDWRANAPVAAMNRLIEEFGFRLVGAVRYGEEADAQPLWSLSTWFGAPADKYTDALAQLPPEQVYAAQLDVPEPGGQPHTVGFPTTTPAGVLRWGWDKLASAAQTGFPAVPGTWQLQTTRIPAAWNVKVQGLNQPVSAMVVDAAAVALPGHEDVRLTGAPGFEVAQNIHHGVWVASILGSGHNGAQGGVTRAGIDGANPLQDVNKAGAQLTIYAANTAPNFSNWKPVGDTLLKKAAGKYTLPAVRVMNCSFGSGLPRRTTHWYFNANLATVAECAEYFAPYALVAAKTAVANSPANQQALTSALLKPYISPNPPSNDRWQSEHDFFAALGNVIATMAKIVKAADIQALVQRLTTDLAGYVVANPAHQATPPEQNPFVQRQLEKATIKFINAGIPKALLDRDILLVNSGGNEGNLFEPGTFQALFDTRPENWVWWGPGYRPPSEYCSTPAYFRFLAGGRGQIHDPANRAPIQNVAAAAANIILVGAMEATAAALKIWSGSNSVDVGGTQDGLYAPGAGLRAASGPGGADYVNGIAGTSFAAPLVSGVASYLLALDPKRSQPNAAGQLRTALIDHSATQDGVRLLDAFATARNFLNPRHP
ncbi:MAG: S8 family serine peptidase, partial [Caldilineaceae bacterium]|nr:S8 family serine peptidase [Caldilineaceae bacterium]